MCVNNQLFGAGRYFLMPFYNGYKGTHIILDDKFFGQDFDKQIYIIKEYISERNYPELIKALLKIENDLWDACASDELVAIIDRFEMKIKDKLN